MVEIGARVERGEQTGEYPAFPPDPLPRRTLDAHRNALGDAPGRDGAIGKPDVSHAQPGYFFKELQDLKAYAARGFEGQRPEVDGDA